MNLKDDIGRRGENIFRVLISTWCDDGPLFREAALGEKHETTDFLIELIHPKAGNAMFFAQVKSTNGRYVGRGLARKLDLKVKAHDVEKLKQINAPTYVFGIDTNKMCGYIVAVTRNTVGGISGISTRHMLDCRVLKLLWHEVDEYWMIRRILAEGSIFEEKE